MKFQLSVKAALSYASTAALCEDGNLYLWGANYSGILADGTFQSRSLPQPVMQIGGGIVIHYTFDNSEPTTDAAMLFPGGSVRVEKTLTLRARAFKYDWQSSPTKSARYEILNPHRFRSLPRRARSPQ